ncbi:MAG: AEC family transporter [Noviherbaspirillum sp.]
MLDILAITSPIYLAILLGFICTRMGVFAKADMRVLGTFVVKLALPALVFNALAQRQIGDILNASYMLAYLGASLVVIGLGYAWGRCVARQGPVTSAFYAMGMMSSNSSFIGYPILLLTLPAVAGVALALNLIVENVIMIPLLLALAERGRGQGGAWYRQVGQSLARLAANPIIIAVAAGLVVSLLQLKLPAPIERTVSLFAMASSALSLFFIGGALVGLPIGGLVRRALPITFGKLIVHPLLVLAAVLALPVLGLPALDPSLRMAAVLMAAMPMMSIYPILAQTYGQEDFAATALLLTTVASFFTLSGTLWLLQHVPI